MSSTTQQGGAVTSGNVTTLRQSTLETLGLGTVLEMFRNGVLPADAGRAGRSC